MNTMPIRTSQHIRTHRELKGFHSCVNATGTPRILTDYGRVQCEEYRRLNRDRQWVGKRVAAIRVKGI